MLFLQQVITNEQHNLPPVATNKTRDWVNYPLGARSSKQRMNKKDNGIMISPAAKVIV